ncbi:MAG TPA: aldehyde dehydrogenase (NADP(+)) [Acetobacteraceae bacterium]|nr:aldehyde dehydrogenase (NADP(+)) [Acetobacteraceae bacterium]
MQLTGDMLIGGEAVRGTGAVIRAVNPSTGRELDPLFPSGTPADVGRACTLAWAAFDIFRETGLEQRARFLEVIAEQILALGDALIERTCAETGLPSGRIEGERGRTVGQLRLFADVVRDGGWIDARIDPALPTRTPLPRSDLRQRHIALGPVAVFGASNFPLAFSVAGGDTASALAAGCPVVAKAHPAHPGTSELAGRAIQAAVAACDLPPGVFSLLLDGGYAVGGALVADPRIKAVGFTGSRRGGVALLRIAQERREPIPVYAEMSSINPVFLLPAALASRGEAIGRGFAGSLTMGAGQFCTNPGLVFAADGPGLEGFLGAAREALAGWPAVPMLTPEIHAAYEKGVAQLAASPRLTQIANGKAAREGSFEGQPVLFATDVGGFRSDRAVQEEVFGAASVLVRCPDVATMHALIEDMEGQLTATLQLDEPADLGAVRTLLPALERKVGRILVNGWPTGVEVGHAMVHGGPYPSTSDSRTTSVGSLAIRRFLRPVCYQDLPSALLPEGLRDGNPLGLWRRVDGVLCQI